MNPRTLGQQVAQHDNDIAAIYDIVARLEKGQKKLTKRVDRVDRRLDGIDGRLDGIGSQLATVIELVSRDRR